MNRRTIITRTITFTTGVAFGLHLLTGAAMATPATATFPQDADPVTTTASPHDDTPSSAVLECSDSHHSDTGHGANNSGGYQSTCDENDFGGNGQEFGPGLQTGKPCAGCVGNADDKNPPGQYPDGSDHNSGYECDGRDRPFDHQQGNGNHGIGDENPAHTGCESTVVVVEPTPELCLDGSAMPATGCVSDDETDDTDAPTPTCPGENTLPPAAQDGMDDSGVGCPVDEDDDVVVVEECPEGSSMSEESGSCEPVETVVEEPVVPVIEETPAPVVEETPVPVIVVEETPAAPVVEATPAAEVTPEVVVAAVTVEAPVVETPAELASVVETPAPVVEAPAPVIAQALPERPTAVLGVSLERDTAVAAAPLARTGVTGITVQLAVALTLLALGFGLVRLGRRPTVA